MKLEVDYDTEIFPTVFLVGITPTAQDDDRQWIYEISGRVNDSQALWDTITGNHLSRMFGFNNLNFDYPLLDEFIRVFKRGGTAEDIITACYLKANQIIGAGDVWSGRVKPWEVVVPQGDLMLIHHLDNVARRTSLKTLQFNMRMPSIEDLPFPPGTPLTFEQIDVLRQYLGNDLRSTKILRHNTRKMIEFRDALGPEKLNFNDTKIGKQFFIEELERRQPGVCYGPNRELKQTWRTEIRMAEVILPWIKFQRPEFQTMLEFLRGQVIKETKGAFKDLHTVVDGFRFDFGTGGIHGSVTNRTIREDAQHALIDLDVTSYYPALAIVNRLYPAHLGTLFCDVYRELRDRRVIAKRAGDKVQADALKLANNGVYGDSNNQYSPFYDPAYTMAITVNGQLLLCMLAEALMMITGLELFQINTDGLTVRVPRAKLDQLEAVCSWWQAGTGLELERAAYAGMWVRDVNNYLGLYNDDPVNEGKRGTVKRKGAYDYEMKVGDQVAWWKDFSGLVIPRAAEAALIYDQDPADFIEHHVDVDPWDFLMRAKVNRGSQLQLGDGTPLQSTVRYFLATDGQPLVKIMPALKGQTEPRRMGIHAEGTASCSGARGGYVCSACSATFPTKALFEDHNRQAHGWRVQVRNRFNGTAAELAGLDLRFYIQETEKLLLT